MWSVVVSRCGSNPSSRLVEEDGDAQVSAQVISRSATARAARTPPTRASAESGSMATQRGRCSAMMPLDAHEMLLRGGRLGAQRVHPQQALGRMGREMDAHLGEIAHDVARVLIEGDETGLARHGGRPPRGRRPRALTCRRPSLPLIKTLVPR